MSKFSFSDTKSVLDRLLSEAIVQTDSMMRMMANSCPGGEHGKNPNAYESFVKQGQNINKQLGDLRVAVAKGKPADGPKQIDALQRELRAMVETLRENCPGGKHGQNPVNYGALLMVKENESGKLDAIKAILEIGLAAVEAAEAAE
ncbi:hypothetical protein ELH80_33540 [Rhizobium ruizarguesonis]|uniref:Uncharacterized protein n=1 Tax=Rhizobium ruizarguesonis TaxID=2081791 RepID=A0AAE4YYF0_9HYPH|nr:hypothetical protein [Rhizobium ruizarguesonis]MCB2406188.1 hypothetical protein [Rhizobium ruizarguesonis]NEI52072.1 hypothetical protein [Rhizobium ruizarguesonis]TAY70462.1 hypothetical protein ELH86_30805 [Rhizobium ruizarguesonis]TAZ24843.1 hypothetical protein ELH80_33540 [Rhizobium ruizarguesonis]TBA56345.1 hypothetical protein ELH58_32470 [Rhizobium ruizarguesonis]